MNKIESSVKVIPFSAERVYCKLSDLSHLELAKDQIAATSDKVQSISSDRDTVTVNMLNVGDITLKIIERDPCKCVKFKTVKSPLPFDVWIHIDTVSEETCKMRMIVDFNINPLAVNMIRKPALAALEKMAEILGGTQY